MSAIILIKLQTYIYTDRHNNTHQNLAIKMHFCGKRVLQSNTQIY